MGFVCCQPWQRSAWPHHCPHTPAGSSFSSREGNLLCCCPFSACSAEFKCHRCDTIQGKAQTNLESLTSTHRGGKKKENHSEKQHLQSHWHITTLGAPLGLSSWDSSCHQELLEAEGSRSSQALPLLAGERSFPVAETNLSRHLHPHHLEGKLQKTN